MNTYLTIPARYLLGRKTRSVLTTLAVVFGVAVIFGVNMLLPTITTAFDAGIIGASGQADLTITSASGETFDAAALATVRATSGVAAAAPSLQRQIPLPGPTAPQITLAGVDPAVAEDVRRFPVSAGRFLTPADTRAVVLTQDLAQALGLGVGGSLQLPTPSGLTTLPVVGVVTIAGQEAAYVPLALAQQLFNAPGRISHIEIAVGSSTTRDALQPVLQARLGAGYDVGTAVLASDLFSSLQTAALLFTIFGFLTLFMGAFLIFNTFRAIIVERRHDIGMLRAVGATRGTIARLILAESAWQGVIGTILGLVLGWALAAGLTLALQGLLSNFFRSRIEAPVVTADNLILAVVLGIGVTLLAGLWPAITAGRVPVLVALRDQPVEETPRRARTGLIAAVVLLVLGIAALASGNSGLVGVGALVFLAGLVVLTPSALVPITRLVDPLLDRIFAREGLIARGNIERNPGRAAVTVSALLIGLAICVGATGLVTSITGSITRYMQRSMGADMLLLPPNLGLYNADVGVGPSFEQQLSQVPGVGAWAGLRYASATVNGKATQIFGIDPTAYPKVAQLDYTEGNDNSIALLSQERNAIVNTIFAGTAGIHVGDTLQVGTPNGMQQYHVVAIGTDFLSYKISSVFVSQATVAADFNKAEDVMVLANLAPGADPAAVRSAVNNLLAQYPQLTLFWGADWRAEEAALLQQIFAALYVVVAILVIPSLLGLINTLAISVLERTREIGVLRALGATRAQVRKLVLAEALLLGTVGTALGIVGGIAFGWMFTTEASSMINGVTFTFPVAGIIFAIVLALVVSVLASLLPARQAARVQIVQALQYE